MCVHKRIDHTFLLLNGLLLLLVAFVPFTTESIASYAQATKPGDQFTVPLRLKAPAFRHGEESRLARRRA